VAIEGHAFPAAFSTLYALAVRLRRRRRHTVIVIINKPYGYTSKAVP